MSDMKPSNPKDIIGSDKLPLHLWPETATMAGSLALLEGALKYGRGNWRHVGVRASIYYDAARRHLMKWFEGHDYDVDPNDPNAGSGLEHLWHALACVAILIDAKYAGKLEDDRQYPAGVVRAFEEMTPHVKRLKEKHAGKTPHHYTIQDAAGEDVPLGTPVPLQTVMWLTPSDAITMTSQYWDRFFAKEGAGTPEDAPPTFLIGDDY